jgi:hypothetical protein
MKTNYQSAIERVNKCQTLQDCDKLDKSLVTLWIAGIFTESEFSRIDSALVDRMIEIENKD